MLVEKISAYTQGHDYVYVVMAQFFLVICAGILFYLLLRKFKKENKAADVKLLFAVSVVTSILIIFVQFIIGKGYFVYRDGGSDTFEQYFPYYVNMAERIKNGTFSVWNWNYGLGKSLVNNVSWTFDPFSLVIVLLGALINTNLVMYLLIWMQIFKILVIYIFSVKLFKLYTDNETAVYMGAYLHAFNGYLMLWGQHYFLGTACVYNIIVLYYMEKLIQRKGKYSGLGLSIAVALSLIYGYYTTYMTLVVAGVYFLVRYFDYKKTGELKFKAVVLDFAAAIGSVLRGILIACIVFLPSAYYVTHVSGRLNGSNEGIMSKIIDAAKLSFDFHSIGTRFSRLMSNNMLFINNPVGAYFVNGYETPQLFITVFIFFFLGQWLVCNIRERRTVKDRILFVIKCILMILFIFSSVSGLILNAFAYPAYRYTFTVVVFLALMVVKAWDYVSKNGFSLAGIFIGWAMSAGVWIYSYKHMVYEVSWYVKILFFVIAFGTFLQIFTRFPKLKEASFTCFAVLVVATTCFDDCLTTNWRTVVTDEWLYTENMDEILTDSTAQAVNWLKSKDSTFYRIEKDYEEWDLFGDTFLEGYSSLTWYDSTINTNVLSLYDNVYTNSSAHRAAAMWAKRVYSLESDIDKEIFYITNTKYLLSKDNISKEGFELINTFDDVKVYENKSTDSAAKWFTKTISKAEFLSLDEAKRAQVLQDTLVTDEVVAFYEASKCDIGDFKLVSQTKLEGIVECEGPGFVMLAVPDEDGWQAYCDGKKVDYINADFGFIAVETGVGTHKITLKYSLPYLKMGALFSMIGLLLCLAEPAVDFIRRKKAVKEN